VKPIDVRAPESRSAEEAKSVNDVTSFLAVTAAIFAAITGLLVVMSRLESRHVDHEADDGPRR
jgi:diacylglycerol kinase